MESSNHVELWELTGSHWVLPIMAEISGDTVRVTVPEIPLLLKQRAILNNALSQLATGGTETERVMPLIVLEENAKKSEQTDAESVVVWNRVPPAEINFDGREYVDEFLSNWLTASGFSISKASASAIFVSLCTHMMHWLVNRRRPVNLLFGIVHPFQYRKNWKEILLGMAWFKTQEAEFIKGAMNRNMFVLAHPPNQADMAQAELLAYNRNICEWNLEFVASEWFHKHSNEVERNRRDRHGGNYLVSVCRSLVLSAPRAIEVYKRFLHGQTSKIVSFPEFHLDNNGNLAGVKTKDVGKVTHPHRAFVLPADLAPAVETSSAVDAPKTD